MYSVHFNFSAQNRGEPEYSSSDFILPVLPPVSGGIPNKKNGLIFTNFMYIFPNIMKKVFVFSQM